MKTTLVRTGQALTERFYLLWLEGNDGGFQGQTGQHSVSRRYVVHTGVGQVGSETV